MARVNLFYALPIVLITASIVYRKLKQRRRSRSFPLPPGPKGLPVIGNVLDIPRGLPLWEGSLVLGRRYNTDILYLNLLGKDMMILNSTKTISDLLDKRSKIYSDKPQLPMAELLGLEWAFSGMRYGKKWKSYRRLFHDHMGPGPVKGYEDAMRKAADSLLVRLEKDPKHYREHTKFLSDSLSLEIAYGLGIESPDHPILHRADEAMNAVKCGLTPGKWAVDILPFLKYVPKWFPGATFRKFTSEGKRSLDSSITVPFGIVKQRIRAGEKAGASVASACLQNMAGIHEQGLNEEAVRSVVGIMHLAGADTTDCVLSTFFLAMTLHQRVQKKAQAEIERVVGKDRLPDFSDLNDLPYLVAMIKELLRWNAPAPLGTSHAVMEDDVYEGWFIPAGTMFLENIWGIFHDEAVYPDSHTFNPDRFLTTDGQIDPSVPDPEHRVFGSGRRICPGRHFAVKVVFIAIARVLATFDILPPVDENEKVQMPRAEFTRELVCHPRPFECIVKPRSGNSMVLIADSLGKFA
ncbi:cytochrome P450 [Thelephora ganbajun]|uniref:Cytochrome P450 n=1 Tax=Thelephora ganbajun TaxID=370292 RepID=A0ACB6ZAS5_THEGA|nr:cytochrome P450 [Thelephora ganbajun]